MAALAEARPASTQAVPPDRPRFLHVFPTFAPGGVQIRMAGILNRFGSRARHIIVSLNGEVGARSRLRDDADIEFPEMAKMPGWLPARLGRIRALIRAAAPDLLLTYNWGAIEWALANRLRPVVRHVHLESGFGPEEAGRQIPRRVWMRRLALARTATVIVPSRSLLDIATSQWRLAPGKLCHIPNGVDCEQFSRPPEPGVIAGFARQDDEIIIGAIAPLRAEKNLGRLLKAFASVAGDHDARLLIIGDGPERAALEQTARDLGIAGKVVFAGHVEAVERVIGWIDIHALSSDTEQMPNTVLQAMAAAKPVAAMDVGDVAAILSPQNRPLIAPAGDGEGLAAALRRLLDDPGLRQALGVANAAHVRAHYPQAEMFRRYGLVLGLAGDRQAGARP